MSGGKEAIKLKKIFFSLTWNTNKITVKPGFGLKITTFFTINLYKKKLSLRTGGPKSDKIIVVYFTLKLKYYYIEKL